MRKTVSYEAVACDFCGEVDLMIVKCLGCKKDICRNCATVYSWHGYKSSSNENDGVYCKDCNKRRDDDPVLDWYIALEDFYQRKTAAQAKLSDEQQKIQDTINKLLGRKQVWDQLQ